MDFPIVINRFMRLFRTASIFGLKSGRKILSKLRIAMQNATFCLGTLIRADNYDFCLGDKKQPN